MTEFYAARIWLLNIYRQPDSSENWLPLTKWRNIFFEVKFEFPSVNNQTNKVLFYSSLVYGVNSQNKILVKSQKMQMQKCNYNYNFNCNYKFNFRVALTQLSCVYQPPDPQREKSKIFLSDWPSLWKKNWSWFRTC